MHATPGDVSALAWSAWSLLLGWHSPAFMIVFPPIMSTKRKPRGIHHLCPHRFCSAVTDVTVDDLKAEGIDTVLLDLDNTLVGWQRSDFTDEVVAWLKELRDAGMKLYLVSNTRFSKRIAKVSEDLGIPHVRKAWKPRRRGFLHAMQELGSSPEKTVVI